MLDSYQLAWVFFWMVFCHVIADYNLQGCLSSLKQKDYWDKYIDLHLEDLEDKTLYNNDYIPALMCHSFTWTFMVCLPLNIITVFKSPYVFILFGFNFTIHAIVDDLKANKKQINLCIDQTIHILQIFITWVIFMFLYVA